MHRIVLFGIGVAAGVYGVTYALHLMNRSSDLAVAGGYLILLLIFAGTAEWFRRRRCGK